MEIRLTIPLWSLLAMVAWTLLLVIIIGTYRSAQIHLGRKRANEFPAGVPHGPALYWRLNRAHLNSAENLPLFAAVVLVADAAQVSNPTLDLLAVVYVIARISQSVIHVIADNPAASRVRFFFFTVQLAVVLTFLVLIPMLDHQRAHPEAFTEYGVHDPISSGSS